MCMRRGPHYSWLFIPLPVMWAMSHRPFHPTSSHLTSSYPVSFHLTSSYPISFHLISRYICTRTCCQVVR